jgi:hypothetical protein
MWPLTTPGERCHSQNWAVVRGMAPVISAQGHPAHREEKQEALQHMMGWWGLR